MDNLLGEKYDRQLRSIVSGHTELSAGTVRLIGLADVRAHFKNDWPEVKDRVFRQAQIAIDKTLGEHDISIRVGDEGFLFIFADPDPAHAEVVTNAAASSVRKRLFGESTHIASHVSTQVRNFVIEENGLTSMLADSENIFGPHDEPCPTQNASGDHGQDRRDIDWRSAKQHNGTEFWPIWDARKNVVINFLAKPRIDKCRTNQRFQFGAADTSEERQLALKTDLQTVQSVKAQLRLLEERKSRLLISACISASSFSTQSLSTEITAAIRSVPAIHRDLLEFVIYETRTGVAAKDVEVAAQCLQRLCRSVRLTTCLREEKFERAKTIGVKMIGFDLSFYDQIGEQAVMEKLTVASKRLSSSGLALFLDGVNTKSLASFATCTGALYVSGATVGSSVEEIPAAFRFMPPEIYADH